MATIVAEATLTPTRPHLTLSEFKAVADSPAYQSLDLELWEGELVEMAKPNPYHSLIVLELIFRIPCPLCPC